MSATPATRPPYEDAREHGCCNASGQTNERVAVGGSGETVDEDDDSDDDEAEDEDDDSDDDGDDDC